jgi:hypothetical protein
MNYSRIYSNLILRAQVRTLAEDVYTESHHIVPKCIGGDDSKSNLVELTPEEHFLAHQLLTKIHPNEYGLIKAANMMTVVGNGQKRNTNKLFGWLRRKHSEACKNMPQEQRDKIAESLRGRVQTEEHVKNMISGRAGYRHSQETIEKIKASNKGLKRSEEAKKNIAASKVGRPSHRKGTKHSEESKLKMSLAKTGKKYGPRGPYKKKVTSTSVQDI